MSGSMLSNTAALEWHPLAREFYLGSTARIARALLGRFLVRRTEASFSGGIIVETEAYLRDDPASHGFRGETRRNRSMYGPPGHAYVYFIYGNHYCLNAVCGPAGVAEAVLLRAIEPIFGLEWMEARRGGRRAVEMASGPGKICQALAIGREHDAADLCDAASPVFIAENPGAARWRRQMGPVVTAPRIGLSKAADRPLRFYLGRSAFVSQRNPGRNIF